MPNSTASRCRWHPANDPCNRNWITGKRKEAGLCNLASILVDDQRKAEDFYVGVLGFKKKHDFPVGGGHWLTVIAPDGSGAEILLEPNGYDFSQAYQKTLYERGIPLTSLGRDDVETEHARLTAAGVAFRGGPTKMEEGATVAVFEDTCGNLIMLHEV